MAMEKGPSGVKIKTERRPMHERIAICADNELHDLWTFCTENATGVPELMRNFMREVLPPIKEQILARMSGTKKAG